MLYRQMLELFDMLDRPQACGKEVKKLMLERGADEVTVHTVEGTDDNLSRQSRLPSPECDIETILVSVTAAR